MVDYTKIAMMVVALILIVLIPVATFFRFRKNRHLTQGLIWGLVSFIAFGIIRTLLMVVVSTVIFPSPGDGLPSEILQNNGLLNGFVNATVGAIAFLSAGLITYRFQLKKVDDEGLPLMNSLVFNVMSAMGLVSQILQYILISVNANAGNLQKYVTDEISLDSVKELVANINRISPISFFDLGFSRWLEVIVFAIAFTFLYRFMKKKDGKFAAKYVLITFGVVFSYLFVGSLTINFLGEMPILEVLAKVLFVGLLYFGFKYYEENRAY